MKILHITNQLSEGGVESFLLQLLPRLREKGHEVTLLVVTRTSVFLKKEFEDLGIKVMVGKYKSPYNPLNIFYIKQFLGDYDVVHTHLWPAQLYVALAWKLSNSGTSLVTTEHNNFNKRRKYKFYRPIEQWMYSQFKIIVGVCDASKNNLSSWISHKHVISIPNGIERNKYCNAKSYDKSELNLPPEAFVLTMTARFFPQKDHQTLIQALSFLPSYVYLLLVGSGSMMQECKELAESLKLAERVYFLGRRTDVERILKTSDLCVLSTHYEGLPISIIEYMSAGRAVVATDVEGVRELVNNEELLSVPGDSKDLAQKIRILIEDREKLCRVANQNLIQSEMFSVENMVFQYNNVYKKLSHE